MKSLQEVWSIFRVAYATAKAERLYGRALRLEQKGKAREALEMTKRALDCLPTPKRDGSDPTVSMILVMAANYAELASRIGAPHLADDAIRRAIDFGGAYEDNPKMGEYVAWLRRRLLSEKDDTSPSIHNG